MHIGKDGSKSKTKGLYILPMGMEAYTDRDKVFVDNTDHGYIMFNIRFTYLGSIITDELKESAEIHAIIGEVNDILLHSLNNLWRSKG
jgi:hypothetical protein